MAGAAANISVARAVGDAVRTSLGPRGMDKLLSSSGDQAQQDTTNDGGTAILSRSLQLQETAVVLLAGSLLRRAQSLLSAGAHRTAAAAALDRLATRAVEILHAMAIIPANGDGLSDDDRESLVKSASTALLNSNKKAVVSSAAVLSPLAVDAALSVVDPARPDLLDLRDIRVVKKLGGTMDDTQLVRGGLILDNAAATATAGGPTRFENAKIAVIRFQISPPKPKTGIVPGYAPTTTMDRNYILLMVKKIKAAGCNVLLIQKKSVLRDYDAATDLSLRCLAKANILVVSDVERDEIEFTAKALNCLPIASIEQLRRDKLGYADVVEQASVVGEEGYNKVVKITGGIDRRTATVLVRGPNWLLLDEAERGLRDALCAIRCLVNKRLLIAGGGAPEIQMSMQLAAWAAKELRGMERYCFRELAEALEVIPYTLAEKAGLNPASTVAELRKRHARGEKNAGINVRTGRITDNVLEEENVAQPLLVSTLACECVGMILKIN